MRVVISPEHFLDLVEQLQRNSLAMLAVRTLYLLQNPQLRSNLIDIVLVMRVDGLVVIDLTGLLILDDVVLRLQPLELIGNLQLQGRVGSEVVQQRVEVLQLLVLRPSLTLDLIKVVLDLQIRSIILLRLVVLLQVL
jgi:hypothetical protein